MATAQQRRIQQLLEAGSFAFGELPDVEARRAHEAQLRSPEDDIAAEPTDTDQVQLTLDIQKEMVPSRTATHASPLSEELKRASTRSGAYQPVAVCSALAVSTWFVIVNLLQESMLSQSLSAGVVKVTVFFPFSDG